MVNVVGGGCWNEGCRYCGYRLYYPSCQMYPTPRLRGVGAGNWGNTTVTTVPKPVMEAPTTHNQRSNCVAKFQRVRNE